MNPVNQSTFLLNVNKSVDLGLTMAGSRSSLCCVYTLAPVCGTVWAQLTDRGLTSRMMLSCVERDVRERGRPSGDVQPIFSLRSVAIETWRWEYAALHRKCANFDSNRGPKDRPLLHKSNNRQIIRVFGRRSSGPCLIVWTKKWAKKLEWCPMICFKWIWITYLCVCGDTNYNINEKKS